MPALDAHLHYRMIDVSSIKELARRWYPRAYYAQPEKRAAHRALADIRESVQELSYYRAGPVRPATGTGLGDRARDRRPLSQQPIGALGQPAGSASTRRMSLYSSQSRDAPAGSARTAVTSR